MTRDIDVIIPQKDKALIADLVEKVAKEQSLPQEQHSRKTSFLEKTHADKRALTKADCP